jgi:hypothetical protein
MWYIAESHRNWRHYAKKLKRRVPPSQWTSWPRSLVHELAELRSVYKLVVGTMNIFCSSTCVAPTLFCVYEIWITNYLNRYFVRRFVCILPPSVYTASKTSLSLHHHHIMTYLLTSSFQISRFSFQHLMAAKVAIRGILLNMQGFFLCGFLLNV